MTVLSKHLELLDWMSVNNLMLNPDKMKALLAGNSGAPRGSKFAVGDYSWTDQVRVMENTQLCAVMVMENECGNGD